MTAVQKHINVLQLVTAVLQFYLIPYLSIVGFHMTSLKFKNSDISYTKYSSDLNLGEGLCIFTSFHYPDSGLYLLNAFDFYFDQF